MLKPRSRSPTFYEFDSTDLLKLYRELDDRDEGAVVIYHSPTPDRGLPLRTDISYANEPVPTRPVSHRRPDDAGPSIPLVRIVDGEVTEERSASSDVHRPSASWDGVPEPMGESIR